MCGICGIIDKSLSVEVGKKMVQALYHRGPDHQETKAYPETGCVLGHARLSILDLSASANQPMEYGELAIVFNGEIYNFREIRKKLEDLGHRFLLMSDTEVILHAYAQWGIKCVDEFIGMFAFAILDRAQQELVIVRDRAGVKPLYFYLKDQTFLFASEMKAFYQHPEFSKDIDMKAVALFFKYGSIPAPYAIFRNTQKLMPGHYLTYSLKSHKFTIKKYWDVMDYFHNPLPDISYHEAKEELQKILLSAFRYRMVADVPVGVFMSGGYDSVGVTALLQSGLTEKLKTFTIGFPSGNNEAPAAKAIAQHLGTDHTEYICTHEDCKRIIPDLQRYYDEPFADDSAVPTLLLSQLARKQVKVALSADGGDEIFAGYRRYAGIAPVMKKMELLRGVKSKAISRMGMMFGNLFPDYSFIHEKVSYFARSLSYESQYRTALISEGAAASNVEETVFRKFMRLDYPEHMFLFSDHDFADAIALATAMDYINYMPNTILVKVDRATMSTSLEGREPLLDHRIIEFAARIPSEYKFGNGQLKRIYKDIIYDYVPKSLMDRPKTGFYMPTEEWMRNDLKFLLEEYINSSALDEEIFNIENTLKLKKLLYDGKLTHKARIVWRILMFQMWQKNLNI